ncbi:MAG: hypothetical protein ACJ8CB_19895 [Ktedonobacteraceae bacterium]
MLPIVQRYLRQSRLNSPFALLSIGLLLVVISAGIVACASSSTGSQKPTPTTPTQAQKCGSVQTNPRGIPLNEPATKQAENCFWQAYQQCHAASLSSTTTSVDTVTVRTFTIQNNGEQCSVSDAVQHAIVPARLSAPRTYTCTGVMQQADGLHFTACGEDGNVVVPMQKSA